MHHHHKQSSNIYHLNERFATEHWAYMCVLSKRDHKLMRARACRTHIPLQINLEFIIQRSKLVNYIIISIHLYDVVTELTLLYTNDVSFYYMICASVKMLYLTVWWLYFIIYCFAPVVLGNIRWSRMHVTHWVSQ